MEAVLLYLVFWVIKSNDVLQSHWGFWSGNKPGRGITQWPSGPKLSGMLKIKAPLKRRRSTAGHRKSPFRSRWQAHSKSGTEWGLFLAHCEFQGRAGLGQDKERRAESILESLGKWHVGSLDLCWWPMGKRWESLLWMEKTGLSGSIGDESSGEQRAFSETVIPEDLVMLRYSHSLGICYESGPYYKWSCPKKKIFCELLCHSDQQGSRTQKKKGPGFSYYGLTISFHLILLLHGHTYTHWARLNSLNPQPFDTF